MFITLHSQTVLHSNEKKPYSPCTFFPSMCVLCQCVAYDLGTRQAAGVPKFTTLPLFWPSEVLTLGWNYILGISFCSIMSISLERKRRKKINYYFLCGAHRWSRHSTLDLPASLFLFCNFTIYPWCNTWIDTTKSNGRCVAVRKPLSKPAARGAKALGGHHLLGLAPDQWNQFCDPVTQVRTEVTDHLGYKTLSGIHVHTKDTAGEMLEMVLGLGDTHSLHCQYLNSSVPQE